MKLLCMHLVLERMLSSDIYVQYSKCIVNTHCWWHLVLSGPFIFLAGSVIIFLLL